jgi:hypothetical protein
VFLRKSFDYSQNRIFERAFVGKNHLRVAGLLIKNVAMRGADYRPPDVYKERICVIKIILRRT